MTQAIETKYHGPSNVRGSRIIATCAAKRIVLDWDQSLSADKNHKAAAEEMCRRMEWHGKLARGNLKDGRTVWVFFDNLHPVDQIAI